MVNIYLNEDRMKYRPREEMNKSKKIVVNVTPDDHQLLKVVSADNGITISRFVIRALRYYLKEVMNDERDFETI